MISKCFFKIGFAFLLLYDFSVYSQPCGPPLNDHPGGLTELNEFAEDQREADCEEDEREYF